MPPNASRSQRQYCRQANKRKSNKDLVNNNAKVRSHWSTYIIARPTISTGCLKEISCSITSPLCGHPGPAIRQANCFVQAITTVVRRLVEHSINVLDFDRQVPRLLTRCGVDKAHSSPR